MLNSHKEGKDSNRILTDTEDNLSIILQTLAKKAGMEIDDHGTIHGKRIRFHCLRKFLIDRLSAYAGESQWKQIVGKAIDEGAYVSQDQLRGVFQRAMKDLLINGNGKTQKLIELENAFRAVESENAISKTRIDLMQKEVQTIRETVELLYPKESERHIINDKGEQETWTEKYSTPQEYIESEKKFYKRIHDAQNKKMKP